MPRKMWVHFRIAVECGECEDVDEAWDTATDILREGSGGDIIGHTIYDDEDRVIEEAP